MGPDGMIPSGGEGGGTADAQCSPAYKPGSSPSRARARTSIGDGRER